MRGYHRQIMSVCGGALAAYLTMQAICVYTSDGPIDYLAERFKIGNFLSNSYACIITSV